MQMRNTPLWTKGWYPSPKRPPCPSDSLSIFSYTYKLPPHWVWKPQNTAEILASDPWFVSIFSTWPLGWAWILLWYPDHLIALSSSVWNTDYVPAWHAQPPNLVGRNKSDYSWERSCWSTWLSTSKTSQIASPFFCILYFWSALRIPLVLAFFETHSDHPLHMCIYLNLAMSEEGCCS